MSLNERVVRAARGEPVKKLVVVRSGREERERSQRREEARCGREGARESKEKRLTLEVLQQVRYSFTLVLEKERLRRVRPTRST